MTMPNMPVLGLGTASLFDSREMIEMAIRTALKLGYRHFDTAKIYGSEPAVGRALIEEIHNGMVTREELFVTTKLWGCDHHDPVSALKQSLKHLEMEYVDLYLVHWPVKLKEWANYPVPLEDDFEKLDMETTWAGMERCLDMGLCRGIGVSNFSCKKIEQLLDHGSSQPSVNQVEMHPIWRQKKLREFCNENRIHVTAYSPLGAPRTLWGSNVVVENPVIQSIAAKHNATPAQVALSWGISTGTTVVAKSFNQDRMEENLNALKLRLDEEDVIQIEALKERKIMRGEVFVHKTKSPYKTVDELWNGEI
ncbi:hypothetical protein Syun_012368 [Stephania yunnanensis]|uniref:codeinone reductase (NADPH) n=1 Tax=Stephania yunnanensis TaxID=152371 RepID=A0AAP0K0P7_9MAGN